MEKYDGWTIKELRREESYLFACDFRETRTEVIKAFDDLMGKGEWRKYRRKGWMKIVKVKLVEIGSVATETRYPFTDREEVWIRIK